MKSKFWYTFATEVLAYSNPGLRFIIGVVKQDTANKLRNEPFFLMPKNVQRHIPEIFKDSIRHLYPLSLELVPSLEKKERSQVSKFHITHYAKIFKEYAIDYQNDCDRHFIKLISPLCPWTYEHLTQYLTGKNKQEPETVGIVSVIVLLIAKLPEPFEVTYEQQDRDSSQTKNLEIHNIITYNFKDPVHSSTEFIEMTDLVDFIYIKTRN